MLTPQLTRRGTLVAQSGLAGLVIGWMFSLAAGEMAYLWGLFLAGLLFGAAMPLPEDQ